MTNRISIASVSAEVNTGPLVVELAGGREVSFLPLEELPGDAVADIVDAMATIEDGSLDPSRMDVMATVIRAMNVIIGQALNAADRRAWTNARVPVRAQITVLEALLVYYAGAGTPGESDGSDS